MRSTRGNGVYIKFVDTRRERTIYTTAEARRGEEVLSARA